MFLPWDILTWMDIQKYFLIIFKKPRPIIAPPYFSEEDCSSLVYTEKHLTYDKTSL